MLKKKLLSLLLFLAVALLAGSAMAATSVSWVAPADGSSFPVGTIVNPTGSASGVGQQGGTGLDLALVIDESGSMSGAGLAAAQTAAISLVDNLPQNSTSVAVIGFDSSSNTYRVLTALNPDKASVIAAINSITAGGGTNIGSGIAAATNVLNSGHTTGRAMMQVVLSDGYGSYSGQAATAYINSGIVTHTVGVPGHSVTLMQQIANEGHGVYTNVSNLAQLESIFDGTSGNLVGLDHVDIELPDGTWINGIATDGLGNFVLPDWVMTLGINTFTAHAYGTDGTSAVATLNLKGTATSVPDVSSMVLLFSAFAGVFGFGVRKRKE